MDFICVGESNDLSLQSLTTTIIIQKILENNGLLQNCTVDHKTIASRTIEVVNNLPLPSLLKWQLRRMVLPIIVEMRSWYKYNYEKSRVILTQNGMVDLPKSTRDLLNNKNVSLMRRFEVACDHCLEQEIFDIGSQINFPHNFARPKNPLIRFDNLAKIWYTIYKGNFHAKLGRKDISEDYCTEGFVKAFDTGNSAVVNYFLEGDTSCDRILFSIFKFLNGSSFTPDACIKMFKRLNEDERQRSKSYFSAALLKALLKWPYQQQFLKAAESLAKNLDRERFWQLAARIVKKARHGWEDHDYKGLFIDFWKLSSEPKTCGQLASYASDIHARNLLYDVILMRDKRLANFVLDNTTEEFKTQHLFSSWGRSVCLRLIFEKHFEALELFMNVCRVTNHKLIIKFKKDIEEYLSHYLPINFLRCFDNAHLKYEQKENILREFLLRMDKLQPQQMSEMSIFGKK